MDFIKDTFLKLTEYTIPFGKEHTLRKYLPNGTRKDSFGNYYIKIGNSETLFTTHLDTYATEYERIEQLVDGDIVKTDRKTTLGGDNKLGCSILLYMIENRVPGLYYFFVGEEPLCPHGGRYGSRSALKANENMFKRYKRCVAFDRKEKGSVVTRQIARRCCSDVFADALIEQLGKNGLEYRKDPLAYYTDSSTFMDTIPECTNLSAGGWKEHHNDEWVDLSYTRQVAEAAVKIEWEKLPVARDIDEGDKKISSYFNFINKPLVTNIVNTLGKYSQMLTNKRKFDKGLTDWLEFNTWFTDSDIKVKPSKPILAEIKGKKLKLNNINDLDSILMDIYGVPIDEDYFQIYQNKKEKPRIDVDDMDMTVEDYLKLFYKINTGNTCYRTQKGGDEYVDNNGDPLPKKLFIKYLRDNRYI